MALPSLKPTADAQIPQRRHTDPPALWFYVTVGSVIIHLLTFGILRLLLMGGDRGLQSQKNIIPVDVIAVAPKTTSPSSVTPRNPTSANPPIKRTLDPNLNRQVISPPTTRTPQQPSSQLPIPSPNQPSAKPTQKPEVQQTPSPKQQPNSQTPAKKPVSPTNNPAKPGGSATPSSPSTTPTPGTQTGQNSPNSQPGGGLIASRGQPELIPKRGEGLRLDSPDYNDKLATLLEGNTQVSGEEFQQLGISLNGVVELRVGVVIWDNGTATLLSKCPELGLNCTKVLQGNMSADAAVALARKVVQQLRFQPTLMAGKPVPREYYIPLTISPNPK